MFHTELLYSASILRACFIISFQSFGVHPGMLYAVGKVGSCQGPVCLNFELVNFNSINEGLARGQGTKAKEVHCNLRHKNNEFFLHNFGRLQ